MPVTASPVKRNAVLGYGARVVDCPSDTTQRQIVCDAEIAKVRTRNAAGKGNCC